MGMIVHKTDCIVFGNQDQKIRKQNGLHNSLIEKMKFTTFSRKIHLFPTFSQSKLKASSHVGLR